MGFMAKKSGTTHQGKMKTKVVSFRIAEDLHDVLERHAAKHRDESGVPLNASGLARRLVMAAIPALEKEPK
jgi:hypothetical protein